MHVRTGKDWETDHVGGDDIKESTTKKARFIA